MLLTGALVISQRPNRLCWPSVGFNALLLLQESAVTAPWGCHRDGKSLT